MTGVASPRKEPFEEWLREVKRIALERYDFTRTGIEGYVGDSLANWRRYHSEGLTPADALIEDLTSE